MPRLITLALVFSLAILAHSEPVVVTVQSLDQASMESLTQKIDEEASLGGSGASRVTLGAIEATMSRVVDADATYLVTRPPTIPTLALLDDITFDAEDNTWTLRYNTQQSDPADEVNHYRRILYASKAGNAEAGDVGNPCLGLGVNLQTCISGLASDYTVADGVDGTADSISLASSSLAANPVTVTVEEIDHSAVQTITITIPHAAIRNVLGKQSVSPHPTDGDRTTWTFGIGMLFVGSSSNIILHDTFSLIEVSNQLITLSKSNSYSIAKQVTFFTQQVENHPDIYVAKLEFSLNSGHVLESINITINENDVAPHCQPMQALVNALENNGACLTPHPLCEPVSYSSQTDGVSAQWATVVVPVHNVPVGQEVRISTLLTTVDTNVNPNNRVLSSLNFATRQAPQVACAAGQYSSFSPVDHTVAELYRGVGVVAEPISGYISVHNGDQESLGTIDSLLTVVIRPKDQAALEYFEAFPDERIFLDDVYMSHALPEATLPDAIDNTVHTVSGGRSRLLLDSGLVTACPEEAAAGFEYSNGDFTCVTTHDWDLSGALLRPKSNSLPDGPYFVYSPMDHTPEESKTWLQANVIGQESADAAAVADSIIAATWAHITAVGAEYQPHARVYWIWPVYYWPNASPISLKDHTIVSLSWSLSELAATPAPAPSRRLLSLPIAKPPVSPAAQKAPRTAVVPTVRFRRHDRSRPVRKEDQAKNLKHYGKSAQNKASRVDSALKIKEMLFSAQKRLNRRNKMITNDDELPDIM